jgi:5-methylcytosine-specific restriction endonuclease McrA
MKPLNPKTGKPFKHGYVRADGKVFWGYRKTSSKNGQWEEKWVTPESFIEFVNRKTTYRKKNMEYFAKYRESNREKAKIATRQWQLNNPAKVVAYTAKRRSLKLQQTPKWLTEEQIQEIEEFFVMAKELENIFPWKQEVDHIVPLKGKTVRGLHVPWNLQILSKKANIQKSNSF